MATLEDRINHRLGTWGAFEGIRRKVWNLRRLTAGDASVITTTSPRAIQDANDLQRLYRPDGFDGFNDWIGVDIEEGRDNHLLQAVATLTHQTAYTFPDVEFEDIPTSVGAINSLYLKWALSDPPRGCSARHEMRLALLTHLVDGIGWVMVGYRDDKPIIEWVDTIDVIWDLQGRTFGDMRWVAHTARQPLGAWIELAKEQKWKREQLESLAAQDDEDRWDQPVEVRCYYDVEGDKGHASHHLVVGGQVSEEPLHVAENPYTMPSGRPFLPLESCYHLMFPSCKMPISIVEKMLPAQLAIWETRASIRDQIDNGRPWAEYEDGAYDPDELERWAADGVDEEGRKLPAVKRNKGFQPMAYREGQGVSDSLLAWHQINEQEITKQSGVNPYQSGTKVEGTKFAAEVNAIQGAAGLVAGTIAKDFTEFWRRVTSKFLAVAALYDDRPWSTQYRVGDDPITLTFDESDPIRQYLKPDADIVIREDSMTYRDRQTLIQEADRDLAIYLQPQVMMMFPNMAKKAMENRLRAKGEKNLTEWLAAPEPVASAPGGVDPMAEIQASTAA